MMKEARPTMKKVFLVLLTAAMCFPAEWIGALDQARNALRRGELINAEQILNSAIDQAQSKFGRNAPQLDAALDMLSQVYQREKRYADATAAEQWRLDIWTSIEGENGVVVGRVLGQLAGIERQGGNLADAEANSRRALAIMTAAYLDKPPAAQAALD